jgi:ankyrin repeat protein
MSAQLFFLIACAALLSACASVQPEITVPTSEPTPLSPPTVLARENETALIESARRGDVLVVKKILAQGVSVNTQDAHGETALIAAAYGNHLKTARVLIAAGADVNIQDDTQQSAFLIATSEGYIELLKLTLQSGADIQRTDSYNGTGLIRAAHRGHVEVIQELLKTDIKINHVNRLGWTALLEAIILGDGGARHTEVVRLLVNAGADVNLADSHRVTPLAHARQRGYADIIAILERAGAR